jgi:signal transduction histidine kinase
MITLLRKRIAPPKFADPIKTRRAAIVHGVLLAVFIGSLLGIPVAGLLWNDFADLIAVNVMAIATPFLIGMVYRGNLRAPSIALPVLALALVTFMAYRGIGAHDSNILGFPVVIVLTALLLGQDTPWATWLAWAFSQLCFVGLYFAEINGLTSAPPALIEQVSIARVFVFAILTGIMTFFMQALMSSYLAIISVDRESQFRLEENAGKLQDAIKEIIQLNQTLEQRVDERTKELLEAKNQAESANRAKTQFLASMSHELRTPLNAIINFTKFVRDGIMGDVNTEQKENLDKVMVNGKHLLGLINDVLDISKIEAGSLQLFVEPDVDLNEELFNLKQTAVGLLDGKPVLVLVQTDGRLPFIRGDRARIRQILLNLLANACKFVEEGEIIIRASQQEELIIISISDNGPGIAPEDSEVIFESFRQTETGLRQGKGTGLGLSISRRLAEAHGGRLWLDKNVRRGATFVVELPIESEKLQPTIPGKGA